MRKVRNPTVLFSHFVVETRHELILASPCISLLEQECEKRKGTISKLSGIIDIHKTTIDKLKIDVAREQSVVSTLKVSHLFSIF